MSSTLMDGDDELIPEDWPTLYTPIPVWVLLAGCSAQAFRMYAFLAEHINNRIPGKRIAFPSQRALAKAMKLKDYRDVAKYREELAELGAIRYQDYRYAGGMRRRYRYWVRFNPPEGYGGLVSLAQFYQAYPEVKSQRSESARDAAMNAATDDATGTATGTATGESAGQAGGGKKPTSGGGKKPTARGGESPTAQQPDQGKPDQEERDDAPPARSANGRRQASTGSRARATRGEAASGKSRHRLTKAEYEAIKAVRGLLPDDLNNALPAKTPPNLGAAILEALAVGAPYERTPAQLVEYRVMRRWNGHWASRHYAGDLRSMVGPLLAMLKHQPECGDLSCEDRVNIHTGDACRLCEMRREDRKAARAAGASLSEAGASLPRQGAPGGGCGECDPYDHTVEVIRYDGPDPRGYEMTVPCPTCRPANV